MEAWKRVVYARMRDECGMVFARVHEMWNDSVHACMSLSLWLSVRARSDACVLIMAMCSRVHACVGRVYECACKQYEC